MKKPLLALALALFLPFAFSATAAENLKARAARIHASAILVDTHEDVPEELQKKWVEIGERQKTGHVDIPRWREGGMTAPFLAAYVEAGFASSGGAAKKALELIDLIHRLVEDHPADLTFADSVGAIRKAKREGKIAVLIGIEGGHAIEDSLGALSSFYRLGVRYMTLTHTNTNHWADSAGSFWSPDFDPGNYRLHGGLTDLGREVVLEMNRLGMLLDVSHVSEDTVKDVLATSKAPVFASHSSCRALADMPRNLTDEQLRAIAGKGGIVMVNVSSMFLDQKSIDAFVAGKKALATQIAELQSKLKDDPKTRDAQIGKLIEGLAYPRASWTVVVDHIEHVLQVGGPGSAGLGTDFDGIPDPPDGLEDVSKLPRITEELLRRGHSEKEVRGVLGESFLAFWERSVAARTKVPPREGPLPFSKP